MENRIPVLTIRYGVILIYDEIVESVYSARFFTL